jgi:hypothetical protein
MMQAAAAAAVSMLQQHMMPNAYASTAGVTLLPACSHANNSSSSG